MKIGAEGFVIRAPGIEHVGSPRPADRIPIGVHFQQIRKLRGGRADARFLFASGGLILDRFVIAFFRWLEPVECRDALLRIEMDVNHQLILLRLVGRESRRPDADRVIGLHVPCPTAERPVVLPAVEFFFEVEMGGKLAMGFLAPDTLRRGSHLHPALQLHPRDPVRLLHQQGMKLFRAFEFFPEKLLQLEEQPVFVKRRHIPRSGHADRDGARAREFGLDK